MLIRVATVLCLLSASLYAATLYKVVAEDGSVTYTDKPLPGATPVKLARPNIAQMSVQTNPAAANNTSSVVQYPDYQLTMNTPADGETIRNNLGQINVSASLSPQGAGTFQLFMDGALVETSGLPNFQLQNVDRGEHRLQIKFLHNSGKILALTKEHVVYLHKASALINAN